MAGFEDINLHHFTFTYSALIIKPIFCLFPLTLYFNGRDPVKPNGFPWRYL